jgi:hypothetical protein
LYETRDCGRSLHRSVLITSADDDGILRDVAHDVLALYPNVLSLSDPNPVLMVRLDRAPAEYCTISVYDLLGHRRHTVSLREHGELITCSIPVRVFSKGVYFVVVQTEAFTTSRPLILH